MPYAITSASFVNNDKNPFWNKYKNNPDISPSKNEYSKNEYSKNGYEKSEYSKNQKNSRDCNHVKDREMSSYGQQNREQDEKDEYEKY